MRLSTWSWLIGLVTVWFGIFLASSPRKFKTYYLGGIWSMAIGFVIDYVIRRRLGLWNLDLTLSSLLQIHVVTYLGPRFAEGLLFMQLLPKQTSLQLPAAVAWGAAALASDWFAAALGFTRPSDHFYVVAFLSHVLRFTTLLAVYYGMNYERRAERLGLIKKQQVSRRVGKALWKLSWVPFYFGMRTLVNYMERRQRRAG
ncbi:MAG TPA: hypothetical protein GXZ82_12870 [Firmicutes bacterium]|nr:hypothetical protein [Bacillota bacterium]